MNLFQVPFEEIELDTVDKLIENLATEGQRLDFKKESYGTADKDKLEFLKDVSAFANKEGGHIIIGIEEDDATASGFAPLKIDADAELLRFESLVESGLQPRLHRYQSKILHHGDGKILVIRVPQSPIKPHRITARGHNRFWVRNGTKKTEPDMNELRELFLSGQSLRNSMSVFREERIDLIRKRATPIELAQPETPTLVVHLIPATFGQEQADIDFNKALQNLPSLQPFRREGGCNNRYNYDGLLFYRYDPGLHYNQLFRSGALECVCQAICHYITSNNQEGYLRIGLDIILESLTEDFGRITNGLLNSGVSCPLFVVMSIVNAKGFAIGKNAYPLFTGPEATIVQDDLLFAPCEIERPLSSPDEYLKLLRPALDHMWNTAGYSAVQ